jgi:hypothetical protein
MRELLVRRYDFDPADVLVLRDQEATRSAILQSIRQHLVEPSRPGDVAVFFFSGHGSQVRNSKSSEEDHLDESLVPADSRVGAADLRDKELRRELNKVLDRGARLTVILDSCHSASGVRGLPTWEAPRVIEVEPRDAADGSDPGPPLEDRDAVILTAAEESQSAWETHDAAGLERGVLTWALLRAVRMASGDEPAADSFARIKALVRADGARQTPALAGSTVRSRPLFGEPGAARGGRHIVAVEGVDAQGRVVLSGGWLHGLAVGSLLGLVDTPEDGRPETLRVVELLGLSRSAAEVESPPRRPAAQRVEIGQLFEATQWAAPPGPPLPVWLPSGGREQLAWARSFATVAAKAGIDLVSDPSEAQGPFGVLGYREGSWYLKDPKGSMMDLGGRPSPEAVVTRLERDRTLQPIFLHVPLPAPWVAALEIGEGTSRDKVERVADPSRALYSLVGRWVQGRLEMAWVRQGVDARDVEGGSLPLRSRWQVVDLEDAGSRETAARELAIDASRLARLYSWLHLESPMGGWSYQLALRSNNGSGPVIREGIIDEGQALGLVLRARDHRPPTQVPRRYVYAFAVDSAGQCILLFPRPQFGDVGNRFPVVDHGPQPLEIPLGPSDLFEVGPPFGLETYYLLATSELLQEPWILECPSVREVEERGEPQSALEGLLLDTGSDLRSPRVRLTDTPWSVERIFIRSKARMEPVSQNVGSEE